MEDLFGTGNRKYFRIGITCSNRGSSRCSERDPDA